jgi:hypothetical protein
MLTSRKKIFVTLIVLISVIILLWTRALRRNTKLLVFNIAHSPEACSLDVECTARPTRNAARRVSDVQEISVNDTSAIIAHSVDFDSNRELYLSGKSEPRDVTSNEDSADLSEDLISSDDNTNLVPLSSASQLLPVDTCQNLKDIMDLDMIYDDADDWQIVQDGVTYVYSAHADYRALNHTIVRIFGLMLRNDVFNARRSLHYCQLVTSTGDVYVTTASVLSMGRPGQMK